MDRVVNQLLTMIDGFHNMNNIFIVGTTNKLDLIHPALLSYFDSKLDWSRSRKSHKIGTVKCFNSGHGRHTWKILQAWKIDGFHNMNNIFIVGTTNKLDLIHPALLSYFDSKLDWSRSRKSHKIGTVKCFNSGHGRHTWKILQAWKKTEGHNTSTLDI
ncbi:uncharacterized protein LOC126717557 isoform X2 [Quercus robur]|uniref:uncharacterized protein LOC126717557 isoform X2 n=1 Tax=Quercus robur TaxID=38942 RepID=UPI00216125ED|nr:uncharacterized protein LOC126717557 isoform X2 [Quercus robur]